MAGAKGYMPMWQGRLRENDLMSFLKRGRQSQKRRFLRAVSQKYSRRECAVRQVLERMPMWRSGSALPW